jgi:hypothetical protein
VLRSRCVCVFCREGPNTAGERGPIDGDDKNFDANEGRLGSRLRNLLGRQPMPKVGKDRIGIRGLFKEPMPGAVVFVQCRLRVL